jgi:vacuolar iron transporter family protein
MPQTPHVGRHFTAGETIRDVVIGMSDGLTVPFALAAGLSGAVVSSRIVVTAELAEVAAGSIAMGLGGYLAARSDAEHYASELAREEREIIEVPEVAAAEVAAILASYGVEPSDAATMVTSMRRTPATWRDFMMRFELGLEEPDPSARWAARSRSRRRTWQADSFRSSPTWLRRRCAARSGSRWPSRSSPCSCSGT